MRILGLFYISRKPIVQVETEVEYREKPVLTGSDHPAIVPLFYRRSIRGGQNTYSSCEAAFADSDASGDVSKSLALKVGDKYYSANYGFQEVEPKFRG